MYPHKNFRKTILTYVFAAFFCILFNYVCSYFGHGVISENMRFAFLYPLILGAGAFGLLAFFEIGYERISYNLYNAGIATITVGSIYQGGIDISGADTTYSLYYRIIGVIFILFALFFFARYRLSEKKA